MSNQYFGDNRRRATGPIGFSTGGRRTAMGYWVPLAVTVGIATVGLAAWAWSERQEDDRDDDRGGNGAHVRLDPGADDGVSRGSIAASQSGDSVVSRVQGALRHPQHILDGASKKVAAGVAAAGAAFGGALAAIREEDGDDTEAYPDAPVGRNTQQQASDRSHYMSGGLSSQKHQPERRKKTVAVVVSSVASTGESGDIDDRLSEHSSILAHLPEYIEPETAQIFVLIYAPGRQPRTDGSRHDLSVTSSYSNIGHEEAAGADSEAAHLVDMEPRPSAQESQPGSPLFNALHNQAQAVVDNQTMIMPFNTPTGHLHILRHLSPDIVYVQEGLTGDDGDVIQHVAGWVRQVVVIVGDEGGRGGLIDSDDESALAEKGEKWWEKEGVTGPGKRIAVVDGLRTGEDWRRRVCGHE